MRISVVNRCSPLRTATEGLRDAFFSRKAIESLASKWDAAEEAGRAGAEAAMASFGTKPPLSFLPPEGRKQITVSSYTNASTETISLPNASDLQAILDKTVSDFLPAERLEKLEKFMEKFQEDAAWNIAMIASWEQKTFAAAASEYAQVGCTIQMALQAFRAGINSENLQFEAVSPKMGKLCLVIPPSNAALLALKDAIHMTLEGYRVVLVCQPRFFAHFQAIEAQFRECGLDCIDIVPGLCSDADPTVLDTVLSKADRLQYTGSSETFRSLRSRAFEIGNRSLSAAGQVSGINKVELHGVSVTHPAPKAGVTWAATANHGELCTSASLVEFDPAVDTAEQVKNAFHDVALDAGDFSAPLLSRQDTRPFEVLTDTDQWPTNWWDKRILASPHGAYPLNTSHSLGHCIYAKTLTDAYTKAVSSSASNVYLASCPDNPPYHRVGTTGEQIPFSCFGGMRTHMQGVQGDHHGVGTLQHLLSPLKRRDPSWKDKEETFYEYTLSDRAEDMMTFIELKDQQAFVDVISSYLEVLRTFHPEVLGPYKGQPLVQGEGFSQLYTVKAWRKTNLHVLVPNGDLPEDIAKLAVLWEMTPLPGGSVTMHVSIPDERIGRLKDPLKSFVKCVKKLGWIVNQHKGKSWDGIGALEKPSYFVGLSEVRLLPDEIIKKVIENGGQLQEGIPSEPFALMRMLTSTQAITCAGENVVAESYEFPESRFRKVCKKDPLYDPEDDTDIFSSESDSDDEKAVAEKEKMDKMTEEMMTEKDEIERGDFGELSYKDEKVNMEMDEFEKKLEMHRAAEKKTKTMGKDDIDVKPEKLEQTIGGSN